MSKPVAPNNIARIIRMIAEAVDGLLVTIGLKAGLADDNTFTGVNTFSQGVWSAAAATDPAQLVRKAELDAGQSTQDFYLLTALSSALTGYQPIDATLTAMAGWANGANTMLYATGTDAFSSVTTTSFGRGLLSYSNAADARSNLGVSPYRTIDFHATLGNNFTATAMTAAARLLNGSVHGIRLADLTNCTQVRLSSRVTTAGVSGSRITLHYATSYSSSFGSYSPMGSKGSEVSVSMTSTGLIDSGWVDIDLSAATDPVYLALGEVGGNGSASPAIRWITAEFR